MNACWSSAIHSFPPGSFANTKDNVSFSPFCVFPEAELSQNYYFLVIHAIYGKCDTLENEYYTEKWHMLTPYGLVRNSFMTVRYGRGSSGYFRIKYCMGIKDSRTSKVFLISPANLLQCKLWGFFVCCMS